MNLFKIELYKLNRSFTYIFTLIAVLVIFMNCSLDILLLVRYEPNGLKKFTSSVYDFYLDLTLIIAAYVIFPIGKEFKNKIVQKHLSLGLSRRQFFYSKLIYSLLVSFLLLSLFIIYLIVLRNYNIYASRSLSFVIGIKFLFIIIATLLLALSFILFFQQTKRAFILFYLFYVSDVIVRNFFLLVCHIDVSGYLPFSSLKGILFLNDNYHSLSILSAKSFLQLIVPFIYPVLFVSISYISFTRRDLNQL